MPLETQIMDAIKTAMRAKDEIGLRALRSIKSAIIMAKTEEGAHGEVSEEQELKLLQKLAKQRRDALEIYEKQSREDLAGDERAELKVIEQFLPAQMSEDKVKEIVQNVASANGFSSPSDMGKLMPLVMKELQGKADGKMISNLVKAVLEGK